MCVEKLSCGRSIEFRGRGQADGWTQGCVVCKVGMEEGWHRTGRLGYRGNGTGASPQSEGQAQPSIDPKGWRPWASQVTGDGCQQSWTGGDGRGGSQPAAGRESPTSSGVPGGLADLPDLGWGGHPQSGLRETGRRRMDRTPGAGAARPWAAAEICPARLPGRAAWEELGAPGEDPASHSPLRRARRRVPAPRRAPSGGVGGGRGRAGNPGSLEGWGRADRRNPGGPRQPSRLLCPPPRRTPFRRGSPETERPPSPVPLRVWAWSARARVPAPPTRASRRKPPLSVPGAARGPFPPRGGREGDPRVGTGKGARGP